MPSILLFGATGLMGSHLVVAIKKAYPDFPLTVYIRDTDPAVNIYLTNSVHVDRTVHGDFSESEKISKVSAEHDIVINAGSSWDVPLSKAIVTGLKSRLAEGKSKATLIHVSGTGNFADGRTDGRYAGPPVGDSKVWNVSLSRKRLRKSKAKFWVFLGR
jgi:nucleoside-diphosphate-sugar epimerase